MPQEHFQLFIVQSAFNSGELRASLPVGEALEIDVMHRRVRYNGRVYQVKTIISAIRNGWIRPATPQEIAHIREYGASPSRKFQTPDMTKIQQERHKVMQESIPADLQGEDHLQVSGEQALRLQDVQTPDQYHQVGGAQTSRIAGSRETPQVPHTEALTPGSQMVKRGTVPGSPAVRPGTPQQQIPGHPGQQVPAGAGVVVPPPMTEKQALEMMAQDEPEIDPNAEVNIEDAIKAAEDGSPSEEQLEAVQAALDRAGLKEEYPKELRFEFDYKHRLSKKREQAMRDMPLEDLHHLMLFLKGRDIEDKTERKITEKAIEIFDGRVHKIAIEKRKARKAEVQPQQLRVDADREAAKVPTPVPPAKLSFNFDVHAVDARQLHLANMVLTPAQTAELVRYYQPFRPEFAQKLADIRAHRLRSQGVDPKAGQDGGPTWEPSLQGSEAGIASAFGGRKIIPNHGNQGKNKSPRADGMRTSKPHPNHEPDFGSGAAVINDGQSLLNAVGDTQPMVPPTVDEMHQDRQAIDMSPVNQHAGAIDVQDVGNQSPPPEVTPMIGTEEGSMQVQSLGSAVEDAKRMEGLRGNDVVDISNEVNLDDLM